MKIANAAVLFLALLFAPISAASAAEDEQVWKTDPGHVDIMLIACHPDDDQLFLGAVIPIYTQQGKTCVTVFMTDGWHPMRQWAATVRPQEARNGLWLEGERQKPVFNHFQDSFFTNFPDIERLWPEDKVDAYLVEQIRKYTPTIIVTQDVGGEYGHLAHKYMVQHVLKVFDMAGDPSKFPASAMQYGIWSPLKLYVHEYAQNKITLDADKPLPKFGGKTAFQVAQQGFLCHKSQQNGHHEVQDNGKDSIKNFGLAKSLVGFSTTANDMFESVRSFTPPHGYPARVILYPFQEYIGMMEDSGCSFDKAIEALSHP